MEDACNALLAEARAAANAHQADEVVSELIRSRVGQIPRAARVAGAAGGFRGKPSADPSCPMSLSGRTPYESNPPGSFRDDQRPRLRTRVKFRLLRRTAVLEEARDDPSCPRRKRELRRTKRKRTLPQDTTGLCREAFSRRKPAPVPRSRRRRPAPTASSISDREANAEDQCDGPARDVSCDSRTTLSPSTNGDVFENFRKRFWFHHRDRIEQPLRASERGRATIAPIASKVQEQFLSRWRSLHFDAPELVFHGTPEHNLPSIFAKGLLVPGTASGVKVAHGSAFGVGIYSSVDSGVPFGYGRGTVLACAAFDGLQRGFRLGDSSTAQKGGVASFTTAGEDCAIAADVIQMARDLIAATDKEIVRSHKRVRVAVDEDTDQPQQQAAANQAPRSRPQRHARLPCHRNQHKPGSKGHVAGANKLHKLKPSQQGKVALQSRSVHCGAGRVLSAGKRVLHSGTYRVFFRKEDIVPLFVIRKPHGSYQGSGGPPGLRLLAQQALSPNFNGPQLPDAPRWNAVRFSCTDADLLAARKSAKAQNRKQRRERRAAGRIFEERRHLSEFAAREVETP